MISHGTHRVAWGTAIVVAALAFNVLGHATTDGASQFTLSNLRFEPDPVEAYGQMTMRVDVSGADAPVVRLWVRLAREGRQVEPVAQAIEKEGTAGGAGTLVRVSEMGEPGPRLLSLVAEDARGQRSAPLETRFTVVEPPWKYEELTYPSGGLKIKGYLYRPAGAGPFPAIIYSHGSRTRAELSEPGRYEWLAYRLARVGYVVFVAERRGYGGSEGQGVVGGEGGVNSLRYGVRDEVKDVLAALAFLRGRPEVNGTRIALVGKSLGGLVSLATAAEDPGVQGVVSLAGGYGFGARMMSPEMLFVQETVRDAARSIRAATLLLHAQNDRIVPPDVSKWVYQELQQRGVTSTLKVYPPFKVGGREVEGHRVFDGVDGFPYFWGDLTEFLMGVLKS
jgi:dienelactone hydrolase